jgi:hypothetical protein
MLKHSKDRVYKPPSALICSAAGRSSSPPPSLPLGSDPGFSASTLLCTSYPHFLPQINNMGFELRQLWSAPEINPISKKAKSIPVFNPVDKYGRVFFFSYLGFFIAFWSW